MSIGERKPTTFVLESVEWRCDLPNAMPVNTLAGVMLYYEIFELKESLAIAEMEEICHDDTMYKKKYPNEVRFTFRCPHSLLEMVKQEAAERLGIISVNQWIIEAINFRLRNRYNDKI